MALELAKMSLSNSESLKREIVSEFQIFIRSLRRTNEYFVEFEGKVYRILINDCLKDWIRLQIIIDCFENMINHEISFDTHLLKLFNEADERYESCPQDMDLVVKSGTRIRIILRDGIYFADKSAETFYDMSRLFLRVFEGWKNKLVANGKNGEKGINYDIVVKEMRKLGYKDFEVDDCERLTDFLVSSYIQVLSSNQSNEELSRAWNLFVDMQCVTSVSFFGQKLYQKVKKLRQRWKRSADDEESLFLFQTSATLIKTLTAEEVTKANVLLSKIVHRLNTNSMFNWDYVSDMIAIFGFKWDPIRCQKAFDELVDRYSLILRQSKRFPESIKSWRPFSSIDSIELKSFLSKEKYAEVCQLKKAIPPAKVVLTSQKITGDQSGLIECQKRQEEPTVKTIKAEVIVSGKQEDDKSSGHKLADQGQSSRKNKNNSGHVEKDELSSDGWPQTTANKTKSAEQMDAIVPIEVPITNQKPFGKDRFKKI